MKFNLYSKNSLLKFIRTFFTGLLVAAGSILFLQLPAQGTPGLVSCGYTFQATSSTWTSIQNSANAQQLANAGSFNYTIDLSAAGAAYTTFGLTTPFNFNYNGVMYNKFGVNGNGFVYFGAAPTATETTPISTNTEPYDGAISAFSNSFTGGPIYYLVQGTYPNRTLTIQWGTTITFCFCASSPVTQTSTGTGYGFSIILHEDGGTNSDYIQLSYTDQNPELIGSWSPPGGQVGLRGATNADFNNRSQSSGKITLNSTTAGAVNTATVTAARNQWINSNILWSYIPLSASITNGGATTWCAGSDSSVVLTAHTNGALPSYQWQTYTPPANTNITGQTATTFTANPNAPGTYLYVVFVTSGACSATSPVDTITVTNCGSACSPPIVSYNNPLCVGDTLKLIASAIANATYNWTGPNGFTSSSQDTFITNVTLADTGAYSVIAMHDTCITAPAVLQVVINPIPASPLAGSNSPVCTTDSIKLTASPVAGAVYNWTGPNVYNNLQNPVKAHAVLTDSGTYSVVAVVNGCSSPAATTHLAINQTPVISSVNSNTPLCVGDTLKLTTPPIANATYNWTGPNNFTNQQNPIKTNVTSADAGSYGVAATVNGCTSISVFTVVVINPIPAAPTATNTGPYCVEDVVQLNATTVPGVSYYWTGPAGFTSNQQNPSIPNARLAIAGTYIVVDSIANCSNTSSTTVILHPTPPKPRAGSNSPICAGSTLILTDSTNNGDIYTWEGPNGFGTFLQNTTIPNATVADSGYYIAATIVSGCPSYDTIQVVINAIPASPTATNTGPYCAGATMQLNATPVNGATYNWTGPNNFTNQQNPSKADASLADSGTYSVVAVVNGCNSAPGTTGVVVFTLPNNLTDSSNSPICAGGTLNLFASNIPGATYNWTGPNNFANQQNPSKTNVTAADSGTYSVIATLNGCNTASLIVDVVINPVPTTPVITADTLLCAGDTLSLSASSTTGSIYNWTGPNNFIANQQNPVITNVVTADSGTYTVIATLGSCVSQAGAISVAVALPPAVPTPGYNNPVCEGSTLNLTAGNIPGATFAWTGPGNFTSQQQNPSIPSVPYADSGTYSLIATLGPCKSPVATVDVAVNETPVLSPAGSNSPVCFGTVLSLTADSITGATYEWNGPNMFSSGFRVVGRTGTTFADTGTYTVTATLGSCTSAPATVNIRVNPGPVLSRLTSDRDTICASDSAQVCTADTFAHYLWNTGAQGVSCIYAKSSGGYWVTVTDANGCIAVSSHLVLKVYAVSSISVEQKGDTLIAFNGTSYQWYLNDTAINGATNYYYLVNQTGTYTVGQIDTNGCVTRSSDVTIVVVAGINELALSPEFKIYPNPATSGKIEVEIAADYIGNNLAIFDNEGRAVYRSKVNAQKQEVDISSLAAGMYILQVSGEYRKFIKE